MATKRKKKEPEPALTDEERVKLRKNYARWFVGTAKVIAGHIMSGTIDGATLTGNAVKDTNSLNFVGDRINDAFELQPDGGFKLCKPQTPYEEDETTHLKKLLKEALSYVQHVEEDQRGDPPLAAEIRKVVGGTG